MPDKLTNEITRHQVDKNSLLSKISFAEYAKIVAEQTIYNDVEIRIADQT